MAEFGAQPYPAGDLLQEIGEPGVTADVGGRELDQQHSPLVAQLVPARRDAPDPDLRRIQPTAVGQAPGVP
jgi:hypothetical protein